MHSGVMSETTDNAGANVIGFRKFVYLERGLHSQPSAFKSEALLTKLSRQSIRSSVKLSKDIEHVLKLIA